MALITKEDYPTEMCRGWSERKLLVSLSVMLALVLSLFVPGRAGAQVAGATLSGTVTDSSGASVPKVQVSIKHIATGIAREATTDSSGFYLVPNLAPGEYEVTATASGFSTLVRSGITLTIGAQQVLNLTMQVGAVSQQVEVTAAAPIVQLESSSLSNVVDSNTVRELPLNGRDWTQLATLQPGVSSLSSMQQSTTASASAGRAVRGLGSQLSISGGRMQQNSYRVDGITMNDYDNGPPGDVQGVALGVDAIQEFSVVTSNYSAEYGRTSGGVVNAITRSGTNQLHGDAYEFLRNSALDARNFFDAPKIPEFRRNQFGASAGAPIIKDNTFIFGDYEGLRQTVGLTDVATVPSAAARSGNLCSIPTGVTPNCLPVTVTVDPNIAKVLGMWQLPNAGPLGNGDTGKYTFAASQASSDNFVVTRVDHHFSNKDSIFGTYQWDTSQSTLPDSLNNVLIGQLGAYQHMAIEETHIFSSAFINNVRFGYNRVNDHPGTGLSAINPLAGDLSLGIIPGKDVPSMAISGGVTGFTGVNGETADRFTWNSFQGFDDAFFTKGKQAFKFGFEAERDQENTTVDFSVAGSYTFPTMAQFLKNTPSVFQATFPGALQPRYFRQTIYGAYLQDDVRLKPNLTINLGIRYEMSTDITEKGNKLEALPSPTAAAYTLGTPLFQNPTYRNFAPRVGMAWDPFGNGKTSVRAGFGIFDVLPLIYQINFTETNVAPFVKIGQVTTANGLTTGAYPNNSVPLLTAASLLRVAYFQNQPKRDYVMQWNLSLQHEVAPGLTVLAAYLGSREPHGLFRADDANTVQPTITPAGYLWPMNPGTVLNPLFGREDVTTWTGGYIYHALEAQVIKHMSHGLEIEGSYTFSKSIDSNSGGNLSDLYSNSITNEFLFEPQFDRSLSDYNVKHNLTINYSWLVPKPNFGNGPAEYALGGWEVDGIFTVRSGFPFSAIMGGDPLGVQSASPYDYPNRLTTGPGCQSAVNSGNPIDYINLSCFGLPMSTPAIAAQCRPFTAAGVPAGTCANLQGDSGRNSLIGPGLMDFDFSLIKNNYFGHSERFNAQFRAEFFNIFNRANFLSPVNHNTIFNQDGSPTSGAGLITATTTTSRQIQFALKLIW